jgi:hypothetical protein
MKNPIRAIAFAAALAATLVKVHAENTITVSSLADSGPGSLRAAIEQANLSADSEVIRFAISGTISLSKALPEVTSPVNFEGTSAPGYAGDPLVVVNFNRNPGLTLAKGSQGSVVAGLSLVGALDAGLTLAAPKINVTGNFIGVNSSGAVQPNQGDGIKIRSTSSLNVIGDVNPVAGIAYTNDTDPAQFSVAATAWQGLRNYNTNEGQYLLCGSAGVRGLLYVGPITGGGSSYFVNFGNTSNTATSVYGPDNTGNSRNPAVRLVGSYRQNSSVTNYGFVWDGKLTDLAAAGSPDTNNKSGGIFRTIAYPGSIYQFTHSTMGDLAVGNADGPYVTISNQIPVGPGIAYICDLTKPDLTKSNSFVTIPVKGLKAKSITAYGIWDNGIVYSTNKGRISASHIYTICGGHSPLAVNNLTNQEIPFELSQAFLVDYDAVSGTFTNWTSFTYPNGAPTANFVSHFEGISSAESGVYTISAQSVDANSPNVIQGSWVSVSRQSDGTFGKATWVDVNYPDDETNTFLTTSGNSVYANQIVGIVLGSSDFSYQATIDIAAKRANVISGNRGNGINLDGASQNVIAMNYIGTDPQGSTAAGYGNGKNGILLTGKSKENMIGGAVGGSNDPTSGVFQRPPLGNLISGNIANGVLIEKGSEKNTFSGNFVGTDLSGNFAVPNGGNGVAIVSANNNSLLGCGFYQSPFVYYNVLSGNYGNGIHVKDSRYTTIQANFAGIDAANSAALPNGGNGVLIAGSSKFVQIGGVIPLGNVFAGNLANGTEIRDSAGSVTNFNTFGGFPAFKTYAVPNRLNGILITATGGKNTIRTCLLAGNLGNGVEISGDASGVQVTDTSCGTVSAIIAALPNQGDGIRISGRARRNSIGGFEPSIEPEVYSAGNVGYGISVIDSARDNSIYHASVGNGFSNLPLPNNEGGIYLGAGTSGTSIGGKKDVLAVRIVNSANGDGLTIMSSQRNIVQTTLISNNLIGVYAEGNCAGTFIFTNGVAGNVTNFATNAATGIRFR